MTLAPIPALLLFAIKQRHPALTTCVAPFAAVSIPARPSLVVDDELDANAALTATARPMNCTEHAARICQPLGRSLAFQT